MEWRFGTVPDDGKPTKVNKWNKDSKTDEWLDKKDKIKFHIKIAKIFGNGTTIKNDDIAKEIGPTRVSFFDCYLANAKELKMQNALTEEKIEVTIDRRKGSVGEGGPRRMERVPAGAEFDFKLTYMVFDDEDKQNFKLIPLGMKLLELTGLGGSGSRGYGKVVFSELKGIDSKFLRDGKLKKINEIEEIIKKRLES